MNKYSHTLKRRFYKFLILLITFQVPLLLFGQIINIAENSSNVHPSTASSEPNKESNISPVPDPGMIGFVELALSELKFYNGFPDGKLSEHLTEAIKKFQTSINQEPTGILTEEESNILEVRYRKAAEPKLIFDEGNYKNSKLPKISRGNTTISAEGAWVIKGEEPPLMPAGPFPINFSKIDCNLEEKRCIEAAIFASPDAHGLNLQVSINYYKINHQDDTLLTAESTEKSNLSPFNVCGKPTLLINTAVSEVNLTFPPDPEKKCVLNSKKDPYILNLTASGQAMDVYYEKVNKERASIVNKEYIDAMNSLVNAMQK